MEALRERAESGESAVMTPELQQAAVCAGQCALQWSECLRAEAGGAPAEPAQEPEATGDAASSAGEAVETVDDSYPLGEPRDDLKRFYGAYGDGDSGKNFFVTAARSPRCSEKEMPPGYLMIGAMWGDIAPWYMKSLSEIHFEQQRVNPGIAPVIAEFDVDGDGSARPVTFETIFADRGRLKRLGDLPEGW